MSGVARFLTVPINAYLKPQQPLTAGHETFTICKILLFFFHFPTRIANRYIELYYDKNKILCKNSVTG